MINLHTTGNGGEEERAAEKIAALAAAAIPSLQTSHQIILEIFPNVQCYGQKIQDIDVVVFYMDLSGSGNYRSSTGVPIDSFCTTIEVKGQRAEDIEFEGAGCFVYYNGDRHDVTHQSNGQKYSLKGYLEGNISIAKAPFIHNIIWLTNCPESAIPRRDSNIIGSDSTWDALVDKIVFLNGGKVLNSFSGSQIKFRECVLAFARKIQPSRIDRRKMESITKGVLDRENQKYAKKIGEQLLVFQGRGGTGKTVRLLRIAYQLYVESGARVILLTYNNALVADIKRLLQLLDVRNSIGGSGVAIKTIHSFMYEWLSELGLYSKDAGDFLEKYSGYKNEALGLLNSDVITKIDIDRAKALASRSLVWDNVLIDEAQDWPADERDIIYKLYGYERVIIADGVDQLVRGIDLVDWKAPIVNKSDYQVVNLRKSLRLKSTLCQAVSRLAETIDYKGWDLLPQEDAHGGQVLVIEGDILAPAFQSRLHDLAVKDGNEPIDVLFCVPPSWVSRTEDRTFSAISTWCEKGGYKVWDGVDTDERHGFPTSLKQFRVVQYDSCRGLEGWTVIACGVDKFFEYKINTAAFSREAATDMFFDRDAAAVDFAKRWLMIPMTRAIDTLILHVENPQSQLGQWLKQMNINHPDIIQWMKV